MSILASTKRLLSENWPAETELPEPVEEPLFDDEHHELLGGFLVEKAMGAEEQFIDSELHLLLGAFVRARGLGWTVVECKFALPNVGNTRIPDLAYLSYETWPRSKRRPKGPFVSVAPDLAVEVISPTDIGGDTMQKVKEYFTAGCKAVWIVWPNVEQIHAYASPTTVRIFGQGDVLENEPVLPGFRLLLSDLFPPSDAEAVAP